MSDDSIAASAARTAAFLGEHREWGDKSADFFPSIATTDAEIAAGEAGPIFAFATSAIYLAESDRIAVSFF